MKSRVINSVALRVVPVAVWFVTKIWFATCRVKVHGGEHLQASLDAERPIILSFWHYSLVLIFQLMWRYGGVAMVSSSKDGEYIDRYAKCYGLSTVRGSRNRQGIQALKELLRCCREGRNVALVADGSQGPARVAQPGSILLSSRTGNIILPVVWSASRYLAIRSWDKTAFPLPFSRVDVLYGEPISVPPGLNGDGIEEYRLQLEQRLNAMYRQVWGLHNKQEH